MPRGRNAIALGCLAVSAVVPTDAPAQEGWADRIDLRAVLGTEAAVETGDGALQKWDFVLEPELTADFGGVGRLTAIGRARLDPADQLEPGQPDDRQGGVRAPASRRLFAGDAADLELRELYLDTAVGPAFLRLGKQQIVWGQADGLRVLDIVNPFSFREFILPDLEDRRIPLWTANAEVPIGDVVTAQFLWIPDHTYDEVPETGATYAFTAPSFVPSSPGGGLVTMETPDRPDRFIVDDDYGVRLTAFLGGWDLSLNYLYHHQDQAVPFREEAPGGGARIAPRYERTHVAGGTFSNAFGDFILRGEVAYSTDRFFPTDDPSDRDGVFETGELGSVLGLDYRYDADLLISGQLFKSTLTHRPSGGVRDRVEGQATLRVEREFLNDTVTAGVLALQSLNDGDGLVQAELAYRWRSGVVLTLGADVFYGTRDGLFGQFDDADRITVGVEIGL